MHLYLDATTRALLATGPEDITLPAALTSGTVRIQMSAKDWQLIYDPLWQAAQAAGQDLIIPPDGHPYVATHQTTAAEQAQSNVMVPIYTYYLAYPSVTTAQLQAAVYSLIVKLGLTPPQIGASGGAVSSGLADLSIVYLFPDQEAGGLVTEGVGDFSDLIGQGSMSSVLITHLVGV